MVRGSLTSESSSLVREIKFSLTSQRWDRTSIDFPLSEFGGWSHDKIGKGFASLQENCVLGSTLIYRFSLPVLRQYCRRFRLPSSVYIVWALVGQMIFYLRTQAQSASNISTIFNISLSSSWVLGLRDSLSYRLWIDCIIVASLFFSESKSMFLCKITTFLFCCNLFCDGSINKLNPCFSPFFSKQNPLTPKIASTPMFQMLRYVHERSWHNDGRYVLVVAVFLVFLTFDFFRFPSDSKKNLNATNSIEKG